jgi:hypothetical protein
MTGTVTYRQLDQLLASLGFQPAAPRGQGFKLYRHDHADTMIVLGKHSLSDAVRSADLVSVGRQLVERGLLDATTFDEFACTGVLPAVK